MCTRRDSRAAKSAGSCATTIDGAPSAAARGRCAADAHAEVPEIAPSPHRPRANNPRRQARGEGQRFVHAATRVPGRLRMQTKRIGLLLACPKDQRHVAIVGLPARGDESCSGRTKVAPPDERAAVLAWDSTAFISSICKRRAVLLSCSAASGRRLQRDMPRKQRQRGIVSKAQKWPTGTTSLRELKHSPKVFRTVAHCRSPQF